MSLKKLHTTVALAVVLMLTSTGSAQAWWTQVVGGSGGSEFTDYCPGTQSMRGFVLHTGTLVDGIKYGCTDVGPNSSSVTLGPWHGGTGGSGAALFCNVNSYMKGFGAFHGSVVNALRFQCYPAGAGATGTQEWTPFAGGRTGQYTSVNCPTGTAVTGYRGRSGTVLDRMAVLCSTRP